MQVRAGKRFSKELDRLASKYPSILEDITVLGDSLKQNPQQGASLGKGCYKVRLPIKSKGKGKSGSGRVITYVALTAGSIVLLSIYDKSEESTISAHRLVSLIREEGLL